MSTGRVAMYIAYRRTMRRIVRSGFTASLLANYLRLVKVTSRIIFEPGHPDELFTDPEPGIVAMWHGQHFMLPFARPKRGKLRVLISRDGDGELNAEIARKLGVGSIRGSAARDPSRMLEKGGLSGFREMVAALEAGESVAMTADLSKVEARRAGMGIVQLARVSGRPIMPVAFATSRRRTFNSWDRATLNLPFSRAGCVYGEVIRVPPDADQRVLEEMRLAVENGLNAATERAYAIADGRA